MGIKRLVKQALTEKENKRYRRLLAEKKMTYGKWLKEQEKLWRAEPAERASENAQEAGKADFVLVCTAEGEIAPYARKNIERYFKENPQIQILYGDEDILTPQGEYAAPWFKPDWSPDLLDGCFYFGSLIAVRREFWDGARDSYEALRPGQWERLFGSDASKDLYRAADLDACEKWLHFCVIGGYTAKIVGHLPRILFHAAGVEEQGRFLRTSEFLRECARIRLADFFESYVDSWEGPLASVVIPSKDQPDILRQCVESVRLAARDIPCEVLVVDNGSGAENRAVIEQMLENASKAGINGKRLPVRYLYHPMEFNFSQMCNLGAGEAKGELLLFLNDDVQLEADCITEMAVRAIRAYTGAVGIKLLYPDSALIQHDGIVNLPVGPVHKLQFHDDNKCYYYGRNRFDGNCVAVTGACLMIEAEKFRKAGGFQESLRVAYNDVELCFRLYESGYHNVVVNGCHAWHHESLSRGSDESREKQRRLAGERELLYQMHPHFSGYDPYYSVCLNREGLDSRIVPAYVSFQNKAQDSGWEAFPYRLGELRRDDCLMARVETAGPERLQGYSVVLGDNNACYEKYLLLIPAGDRGNDASEKGIVYMRTRGQYRQDLEENLPDQENVALGGFCVSRRGENLTPGEYHIAVLAVNRVTGLKLWNETGKDLSVC